MTQLKLSIGQIRQTMQDITTMQVKSISDQALAQLKNLLHIRQDTLDEFARDRILRGMKAGFKDMSYRYQSIDSPFRDTFRWILDLDKQNSDASTFTR